MSAEGKPPLRAGVCHNVPMVVAKACPTNTVPHRVRYSSTSARSQVSHDKYQ
jgi:hypothetical protein